MIGRLAAFGHFWWDFVVGDDWRTSVYMVIAIGATAAIAAGGVSAWWVVPCAVLLVLYTSLRRATRDYAEPSGDH